MQCPTLLLSLPHTSPHTRRYAYRNQPEIGLWNCIMLAQALCTADLVEKKDAEEVLEKYTEVCAMGRRGKGGRKRRGGRGGEQGKGEKEVLEKCFKVFIWEGRGRGGGGREGWILGRLLDALGDRGQEGEGRWGRCCCR